MDKKTVGIIAVLVAIFVGLIALTQMQKPKMNYDLTTIIPANADSGDMPEMVAGNPDAPVILVEYGDYQCTACAPMNPVVNELLEHYGDKVAVVYRTMIMSYHENGKSAASAALAASKQDYWKEYKDILYENQDDWYYMEGDELQETYEKYFKEVSKDKGDLGQFREDMNSNAVAKKIAFDEKLSAKAGVEWTPYFVLEGELVSQRDISREEFLKNLYAKIDAKLEEKGVK